MGWFANSVAFLRLGDAYRGWAMSRESGAGFAPSLGTVLAERIQDMVVVLAMVLAAAAWVTVAGDVDVPGVVIIAAAGLAAAMAALLLAMRLYWKVLSVRLPHRLRRFSQRFQLSTLRSFPRPGPAVADPAGDCRLDAGDRPLLLRGAGPRHRGGIRHRDVCRFGQCHAHDDSHTRRDSALWRVDLTGLLILSGHRRHECPDSDGGGPVDKLAERDRFRWAGIFRMANLPWARPVSGQHRFSCDLITVR